MFAVIAFVLAASSAGAQTQPTQSQKDKWVKEAASALLEDMPCREVTWLLDGETQRPRSEQRFHDGLGWWGRGFVEGAVYIAGEKAQKAALNFGLSVDVVGSHIAAYCRVHEAGTPFDAIENLLLKVLKTADRQ